MKYLSLISLLAYLAVPNLMAASLGTVQFIVAQDGRNTWSGTLAQPAVDQTDGPFATVPRAIEAVRMACQAHSPDRPIHTPGGNQPRRRH